MKHKSSFLWIVAVLVALLVVGMASAAIAAEETGPVFYIDGNAATNGNGTIESPYNNLDKITSYDIEPGTTFYIKCGSVFNYGIAIHSSGAEGKPITITSYGEGPKPIINGGYGDINSEQQAIQIFNRSYITIENLHLQCYNVEDPDDFLTTYTRRSGIWIVNHPWEPGSGDKDLVMKGITLRNVEISNVTGVSLSTERRITGNGINARLGMDVEKTINGGIQMESWQKDGGSAHFEDILIEGCYIHDVNPQGINIKGFFVNGDPIASQHKNVVVRNNFVNKTGCDGIVVGHAHNVLIENNVVYNTSGKEDVTDYCWTAGLWVWGGSGDHNIIQKNEVAYTNAMPNPNESDAAAFDTDIDSMGDYYWQYNYSHDNDGGFYFNMGDMAYHDPNGVNYVRYNISQNDHRQGNFRAQAKFRDPTVLMNNVFYNDDDLKIVLDGVDNRTMFLNNVFYVDGDVDSLFSGWTGVTTFVNNAVCGVTVPETNGNLIFENGADMGFVNAADPGNAWSGEITGWSPEYMLQATEGFKLKENSPLIGAGKYIAGNLSTETGGGRDYYGNSLYTGAPDIGAYEAPDSSIIDNVPPAAPINLKATSVTDDLVVLTWDAKVNGVPLDAEIFRDGEQIAYVVAGSTYTDTNVDAETEYIYTVKAVNNSGIASEESEPLHVTTAYASLIVNAPDGVKTGDWSQASGSGSYNDRYIVSNDPDATVELYTNILHSGYYNVYYWMPYGNNLDTRNAELEIYYAGGSSKLSLDQRVGEGKWVLIGAYAYTEGEDVKVATIRNASEGELNAGAIRLVYQNESIDTTGINDVQMKVGTIMLKEGETTTVLLRGTDGNGNTFDLTTVEGAVVEYILSKDGVVSVENGTVTALQTGAVELSVKVTVNGQEFTTEAVNIQVGSDLAVAEPAVSVENSHVQVKLAVSNFTDKDARLIAIVAVYNADGQMTAVKTSDAITLKAMNATVFDLTVNTAGGETVDILLWNTLKGMQPVADAVSIGLN